MPVRKRESPGCETAAHGFLLSPLVAAKQTQKESTYFHETQPEFVFPKRGGGGFNPPALGQNLRRHRSRRQRKSTSPPPRPLLNRRSPPRMFNRSEMRLPRSSSRSSNSPNSCNRISRPGSRPSSRCSRRNPLPPMPNKRPLPFRPPLTSSKVRSPSCPVMSPM